MLVPAALSYIIEIDQTNIKIAEKFVFKGRRANIHPGYLEDGRRTLLMTLSNSFNCLIPKGE